MLSDSDSEASNSKDDTQQLFTINETFAKAYKVRKEREELSKLKEKYGSDVGSEDLEDSEDSEEDTTEDEHGEELTPALDAAILRTLARIRRKDPEIYEAGKDVFEEEQKKSKSTFTFSAKKIQDKSKPLLMRQHILQSNLRSGSRSPSPGPQAPTHVQEQATLRKETISVFHGALKPSAVKNSNDVEDDEDEDDLFIPREKTQNEIAREQEEYRRYLEKEVGENIGELVQIERGPVDDNEGNNEAAEEEQQAADEERDGKKKRKKKKKSGKTKEEKDHEFLMDYILNRGWVDHSAEHVPTFDEVTKGEGDQERKGKNLLADDLSEEEEFDEVADTFESVYNFRYEEPDAADIATHPRTIAATVRRDENPRKAARERKKERKEEKMLQKREEVKRLKSLKMREVREKLERIGKEGGKDADDEALAQLDLDADWDPDAHDKQMEGLYGYEGEGDDGDDDAADDIDIDLEKPTWEDDIDIADIIPAEPEAGPSSKSNKDKKKKKKKGRDDYDEGDGVYMDEMDADALLSDNTSPSKSKSNVDKKKLDAALDGVYALDFNDIVGGIATRFKYTPVLPQSYGLSAVEILLADDADLNEVVGLKKIAPYRRDKGRSWDKNRGEKLGELKKKLVEKGRVREDARGAGDGGEKAGKKRKGKKERLKEKMEGEANIVNSDGGVWGNEGDEDNGDEHLKKKRKRRHKTVTVEDTRIS